MGHTREDAKIAREIRSRLLRALDRQLSMTSDDLIALDVIERAAAVVDSICGKVENEK